MESENTCNVSKPLVLHWFKDDPCDLVFVGCVLIASDTCEAVSSRVLLPMWAKRPFVYIEVNVIADQAKVLLELIT
jgi:hypothetical protein